ncbi:hypothetical protein RKD49_005411 [Streptomyces glaucescens]|jgi:hypothetical protein
MTDVYSNPAAYGVKLVGTIDLGDYDWAMLGVFQRESDGAILWATDQGCSCWGFLDGEGVESLDPLPDDYAHRWRKWYRDNKQHWNDERDALESLIRKVETLRRAQ